MSRSTCVGSGRTAGTDRTWRSRTWGLPGRGAITLRTTVYSGEASDTSARELEDITVEPGGFHQFSGLLGSVENGYVKVERVEGEAPFYAYGGDQRPRPTRTGRSSLR